MVGSDRAEEQTKRMQSRRLGNCHQQQLKNAMWGALLLAVLGVAGCAQVNKVKSRVGQRLGVHPTAAVTPATPSTITSSSSSLATIVNDELQKGRYNDGENALRRYLAQHPGDRPAQAMLRQLTVDPKQMLGPAGPSHTVQAGESYSTLAARYLGDANLFLVLARYNGSTNPSLLRVGQSVQLPASAATASAPPAVGDIAPAISSEATPASELASAKAPRLQRESVALLSQGHKQQALVRLDEALTINPRLPPNGAKAAALRKDLLADYHQRAIVLYRDQQLDQAIALWNRVLAIDPGYEPAVIYRARALELKQRLKQF